MSPSAPHRAMVAVGRGQAAGSSASCSLLLREAVLLVRRNSLNNTVVLRIRNLAVKPGVRDANVCQIFQTLHMRFIRRSLRAQQRDHPVSLHRATPSSYRLSPDPKPVGILL